MATLFVARSANLSAWASDVGLSKHVFKVGITEEPVADVIARGWAGETDWTLVKKQDGVDLDEEAAIQRLAGREKMIDPGYYPRLKGATGIFKVVPDNVTRHILLGRALAGESERTPIKIKVADFATYLMKNAGG
ncbi:hypothetical protein [Indioceanicola profundi]|uniref:hypothetical protein n=1 Tax=Indioceanicola profundi TaxID=2220096 RepID=UPI000E6AD072|nr:hypothetical protein [Indioceanicola profundi]